MPLLGGEGLFFGSVTDISSYPFIQEFEGTTPGNEPKEIGSGPSDNCKYTELATC